MIAGDFRTFLNKIFKQLIIKLLVIFFTIILCACVNKAVVAQASDQTNETITAVTLAYLKSHTMVLPSNVKVELIILSGNYARGQIIPINSDTDSAIVFLKYSGQHWEVISLGTAFDQTFYKHYQIPKSIQV